MRDIFGRVDSARHCQSDFRTRRAGLEFQCPARTAGDVSLMVGYFGSKARICVLRGHLISGEPNPGAMTSRVNAALCRRVRSTLVSRYEITEADSRANSTRPKMCGIGESDGVTFEFTSTGVANGGLRSSGSETGYGLIGQNGIRSAHGSFSIAERIPCESDSRFEVLIVIVIH